MMKNKIKVELKKRHYLENGQVVNFVDGENCPLSNALSELMKGKKCIAYVHTVRVYQGNEGETLYVKAGGSNVLGVPGYSYADYWEDLKHIEDKREEETLRTLYLSKEPHQIASMAPEDNITAGELSHV
jgi:NADPH-dependent curcumin reductase CurA